LYTRTRSQSTVFSYALYMYRRHEIKRLQMMFFQRKHSKRVIFVYTLQRTDNLDVSYITPKCLFFVLLMRYLATSEGLLLTKLSWSYWGQKAFLCWYMTWNVFFITKKWFEIVGLCCHPVSYKIVQGIKYGNNSRISALFWLLSHQKTHRNKNK